MVKLTVEQMLERIDPKHDPERLDSIVKRIFSKFQDEEEF